MICVRKKKNTEQIIKVDMVRYHANSNSFKCDWREEEKISVGKGKQKSCVTCGKKKQI